MSQDGPNMHQSGRWVHQMVHYTIFPRDQTWRRGELHALGHPVGEPDYAQDGSNRMFEQPDRYGNPSGVNSVHALEHPVHVFCVQKVANRSLRWLCNIYLMCLSA